MKSHFLEAIGFGIAVVLASACGKSNDRTISSAVQDPYFSAVAEQAKSEDPYYVHLKWNTGDTPLLWILDRYTKSDGHRESIVVNGSDREYRDHEVTAGEFYTYYLVAQGPYKYGLQTQVLIPDAQGN